MTLGRDAPGSVVAVIAHAAIVIAVAIAPIGHTAAMPISAAIPVIVGMGKK